jgi:hypothetical protein
MKIAGIVSDFSNDTGRGTILTELDESLEFNISEWYNVTLLPKAGCIVNFYKKGTDACNICIENSMEPKKEKNSSNSKSKLPEKYNNNGLTKSKDNLNTLFEKSEEKLYTLNDNIKTTMNISQAMESYFTQLDKELSDKQEYIKVEDSLDYLLAKRFLWTTYYNLTEIDLIIKTPEVQKVVSDLNDFEEVYKIFEKRTKYPLFAFQKIFLDSQEEYKRVEKLNSKISEQLTLLTLQEQYTKIELDKKKKEVQNSKKNRDKVLQSQLTRKWRIINGTYTDIIHMMGKLTERKKINLKLLHKFRRRFQDDFLKEFISKAKIYRERLRKILDKQAYKLDKELWLAARNSKAIRKNFEDSNITDDFSTQTYLKYYLGTLDETKSNESAKELFEFCEYLKMKNKQHIIIVANNLQDAMEYEYQMKLKLGKGFYDIKIFTNEFESIKWAKKNSVRVLVLHNRLSTIDSSRYLEIYHQHILLKPKVVILGPEMKSRFYKVESFLSEGISPFYLANTVEKILQECS